MDVLCCFPSSKAQSKRRGGTSANNNDKKGVETDTEGYELTDPPPSYDFSVDEGVDYQQRLWHIILEEKQCMKSTQIWRADDLSAEARSHGMTLATVWDLAIKRLTPDSRKLLEFIAFLDPDQIDTRLFIGDATNKGNPSGGWEYWDTDRLNAAISVLCERHLVERYTQESLDYLRTHRALQRSVLQKLDDDPENRDRVFLEVVAIMRKAMPVFNYVKRSDGDQFPIFARCMPHIIALHRNYDESTPQIRKDFHFADILLDAGVYGSVEDNSSLSIPILRTAIGICEEQPDSLTLRQQLCNMMSALQQLVQGRGQAGRDEALQLLHRIRELRQKELEENPRDSWTDIDIVNFGRATVDMGCVLMHHNRVEEARARFEEGIELYRPHESLKIRFYHAQSLHVRTLAIAQKTAETREQAEATIKFIQENLGMSNSLTLQTKSYSGHAMFTIGDVDRSLELHGAVFQMRLQLAGNSHHLTLGSQYCLAVCLHRKGLSFKAREQLLAILESGVVTETWREEDVERTKFRLYLVERELGNTNEADNLLREVHESVKRLRTSEPHLRILGHHNHEKFTDADDMALLDATVASWHGRTAGIWSPGGDIW